LLLRHKRCPLPFFEDSLLFFIFTVLAIQFALPELRDFVWFVRFWRRSRGRLSFNFLLGSGRQGWSFVITSKEVGRILRQLGDCNKACQVSEIGAFVVELDESIMLGVISLPKGLQCIIIAGDWASVLAPVLQRWRGNARELLT
jgi:hypothetical protein